MKRSELISTVRKAVVEMSDTHLRLHGYIMGYKCMKKAELVGKFQFRGMEAESMMWG